MTTNPTPPRDDAPERDVQYLAAVGLMLVSQRASTSYLSRCLNTGYNTAVGIMERLQADGIVSAPNHVSKREVLIRRADQPARVVVAPYTPEVGQAGEDYIKSVAFKGHHDLPAQFRWFALWDAMNAAALLPTEAGSEPGESELDEAWKSGFNAGFGEAMLTKDATPPPAATTDTKALVEAAIARMPLGKIAEIKRRWSGTDGTALPRPAPQAVTVEQWERIASDLEMGRVGIDETAERIRALGGRT